jgi:hypothetical protein
MVRILAFALVFCVSAISCGSNDVERSIPGVITTDLKWSQAQRVTFSWPDPKATNPSSPTMSVSVPPPGVQSIFGCYDSISIDLKNKDLTAYGCNGAQLAQMTQQVALKEDEFNQIQSHLKLLKLQPLPEKGKPCAGNAKAETLSVSYENKISYTYVRTEDACQTVHYNGIVNQYSQVLGSILAMFGIQK